VSNFTLVTGQSAGISIALGLIPLAGFVFGISLRRSRNLAPDDL
jgi:hypothetical protein